MLKIVYEDADLEEFALGEDSDVAVPITVSEDTGGDVTLTVYSRFAKEGADFVSRFENDPFSREAMDYIDRVFAPLMRKYGFLYEREYDQTVLTYTSCGRSERSERVVFIGTAAELEKYDFLTTRDFTIDDGDPCDAAFAVIADGKVVSVASVNDYSDDGSVEINVETAPEYRCRGFASAAASSLVSYLEGRGEHVTYKCRASNVPSQRVATAAGLKYSGKAFYYVCYRI